MMNITTGSLARVPRTFTQRFTSGWLAPHPGTTAEKPIGAIGAQGCRWSRATPHGVEHHEDQHEPHHNPEHGLKPFLDGPEELRHSRRLHLHRVIRVSERWPSPAPCPSPTRHGSAP